MDMKQLIVEARTCRRFEQSSRLGAENMQWLVDCARVSPCARNAQVLRYAVAQSEQACAAIFPNTRWAGALKDWDGPVEGERPTGYVGILMPKDAGKLVHMDVGIAAQTIQLAAASRGWGCCMHASFDQVKCAEVLQVPEDMVIGLLLGLGVAAEVRTLADMPADGSFSYWRDAAQVHYVPKRGMDEVLLKVL